MVRFTQKIAKMGEKFRINKIEFTNNLDNLFYIAFANALNLIKLDTDK